MEDFVTWVDTSKLKRTIMAYNDEVRAPPRSPLFRCQLITSFLFPTQLDDFDLL